MKLVTEEFNILNPNRRILLPSRISERNTSVKVHIDSKYNTSTCSEKAKPSRFCTNSCNSEPNPGVINWRAYYCHLLNQSQREIKGHMSFAQHASAVGQRS